jgi:hypothetical protein
VSIFRITMGFTGNNQGWSEYHAANVSAATPRALIPLATALCQKRAQFLGAPYSIFGFRIQNYVGADGNLSKGSWFQKGIFQTTHPSVTGAAEPGDVAAIGIGSNPANQFPARFFMGAPPDAAVDLGGQIQPGKGGFGTDCMQDYFNFLTAPVVQGAQFGWLVSGTPVDNEIVSITQNTDGQLVILFTAAVGLPGKHSVYYPARIRGVNNGRSPCNGQCLVTVTGANTVTTKEVIAFSANQVGGFCKIYQQQKSFAQYVNIDINFLVGNHRRGRPFDTSRGRAPARVRG